MLARGRNFGCCGETPLCIFGRVGSGAKNNSSVSVERKPHGPRLCVVVLDDGEKHGDSRGAGANEEFDEFVESGQKSVSRVDGGVWSDFEARQNTYKWKREGMRTDTASTTWGIVEPT